MLRIRFTAALAGLVPVLALTGAAAPALARPAVPGGASCRGSSRHRSSAEHDPHSGSRSAATTGGRATHPVTQSSWPPEAGRHGSFGGTNPGGPSSASGRALERPHDDAVSAAAGPDGLHQRRQRTVRNRHLGRQRVRRLRAALGRRALAAGHALAEGNDHRPDRHLGRRCLGVRHYRQRNTRDRDLALQRPVLAAGSAGAAASIYRASAVSRHDIWAIAAEPEGGLDPARTGAGPGGRCAPAASWPASRCTTYWRLRTDSVWVVGDEVSAGSVRLVLAHWNGVRWRRIPTRVRAWPGRLARGPGGSVLITATPADAAASGLDLAGSRDGWRSAITIQSDLGSGVADVALVRRTRSLLASGGILTRFGGNAVIWMRSAGLGELPPRR